MPWNRQLPPTLKPGSLFSTARWQAVFLLIMRSSATPLIVTISIAIWSTFPNHFFEISTEICGLLQGEIDKRFQYYDEIWQISCMRAISIAWTVPLSQVSILSLRMGRWPRVRAIFQRGIMTLPRLPTTKKLTTPYLVTLPPSGRYSQQGPLADLCAAIMFKLQPREKGDNSFEGVTSANWLKLSSNFMNTPLPRILSAVDFSSSTVSQFRILSRNRPLSSGQPSRSRDCESVLAPRTGNHF